METLRIHTTITTIAIITVSVFLKESNTIRNDSEKKLERSKENINYKGSF
ncbi:hypothetical protein M2347_002185 [Chryseobacterium sp. H1D6B]|nr:hypothetical protein [Chryseobacterium sp. H1D6B]